MLDPMPFDSASIELKDLTVEASTFFVRGEFGFLKYATLLT